MAASIRTRTIAPRSGAPPFQMLASGAEAI
jgi:hypothetical protein